MRRFLFGKVPTRMYIRETKTQSKKTNAVYIKHELVESYRNKEGQPRQRVVLQLGRLDLPKKDWKPLAAALESRFSGQESLFEEDPRIKEAAQIAMEHFSFLQKKEKRRQQRDKNAEYVRVDLQSTKFIQSRSLGPELVAHTTWEKLGIRKFLEQLGWEKKNIVLAEALVVGRLIEPGSDLSTLSWLNERSSLLELFPHDLQAVKKDSLYESTDRIFEIKNKLEFHLRQQELNLFRLPREVYLYDLTNTYFEGSALENDLAQLGHSKEKRTDCPLVTLALVVDEKGFPIMSQIYSGNQSEPKTFPDILSQLENDLSVVGFLEKPTIIMDRGIATHDNIKLLRGKYPYLVIERRSTKEAYLDEFRKAQNSFTPITKETAAGEKTIVYVKKVDAEDDNRVLCLSIGRKEKEQAMDTQREMRFLDEVHKLEKRVSNGKLVVPSKISERIGRIKAKFVSIGQYYDFELKTNKNGERVEKLEWRKSIKGEEREELQGCYVIESSEKNLSETEIWHLYMTLTKVEASFRALKTELGLRPVYHQKSERTKAHLFISVLAYHLLISIEYQLHQHGNFHCWNTIRKQLSTHQRCTIILNDDQNQVHHIRVSGLPEARHKEIYKALDVNDPLKRVHEKFAISV